MPDEASFQDFLYRVQAGEPQAWEELVRRFGSCIRRAVRIRLRDAHLNNLIDSADIWQSVLAGLYAGLLLGRFELTTPDDLTRLLRAMAHHKVVDKGRRQKADRRDQRRVRTGDAAEQQMVAPEPTPSEQLADQELVQRIRQAMTEEERRLADLRAEGHEWDEIGAELGVAPETLRKRLTRAIERVARELHLEVDAHE